MKVLDFGLAKALDTTPEGDPSQSPTLTAAATQMGVIMGTAAYMSPEQARGKPVDRRSDIWALGVVLLEMLTGQKVLEGEDVSMTLSSVLQREPDWDLLPSPLGPSLAVFLRRCLEKDPSKRVHDVADLRLAIEGAFETAVPARMEPSMAQRSAWLPWVAGVALAIVSSLVVWTLTRPEVVPASVMRLSLVPQKTAPLFTARGDGYLAISPDGTQVVYVGNTPGGGPQLYRRGIDELVETPLRVAASGTPFFSPDGLWVGFVGPSRRTLQKVSIFGGPPVTVLESQLTLGGANWAEDDQIIFGRPTTGLSRVSAGGGTPEALTVLDREQGEVGHISPFVIQDRGAVLFVISGSVPLSTGQLAVLDLATKEVRRLRLAGISPHYVQTGHLVYAAQDGSVRAVPFDVATLPVVGSPVPVVEDVHVTSLGSANFSISDNGRLIYGPGAGGPDRAQRSLVWVDRSGQEELVPAPLRDYNYVSLSPDGTRAVVEISSNDGALDVAAVDLVRGTLTPITTDPGDDTAPLWSPDGQRILFVSTRNGLRELMWKSADGTGSAQVLTSFGEGINEVQPYSWSPDGRTLTVAILHPDTAPDIGTISVDGTAEWVPLIQTEATEYQAAISPNGGWLAYQSAASGAPEIYLDRFPDPRRRQPVAIGIMPTWSRAGPELIYLSAGWRSLMRVSVEEVEGGESLVVGELETVIAFDYFGSTQGRRSYDLSPDGERFLMIKRASSEGPGATSQINIVLNWSQELLERVPID